MFSDFGSNLLAELAGIVITYFVIERLLKRQEQNRCAPVIEIIQKCLQRETKLILAILVPIRLINANRIIRYPLPDINFDNLNRPLEDNSLYILVEDEVKCNKYKDKRILDNLRRIEQRLENITIQSVSVFDPKEVTDLILKLGNAIEGIDLFCFKSEPDKDEQGKKVKTHYLVDLLVDVIRIANAIRNCIENPGKIITHPYESINN